jgi:hypothetical protein
MSDPTEKAQSAARMRADLDAGRDAREVIAYPDPAADTHSDGRPASGTPLYPDQVRDAQYDARRHDDITDANHARNVDADGNVRPSSMQGDPVIAPRATGNSGLAIVAVVAFIALAVLIAVYP